MREKTKKCQNCQKSFEIDAQDFEFYEKISDKNSEVKVPAPTWCPDCRAKRRMNFYNVSTLHKRKCDKCQSNIIAIYPEDVEFPVYCPKCWWADDWDASEYAQDYDFKKTFFKQLQELQNKVPRVSLEVDYQRNINSPYANDCGPLKNCYLTFLADSCEDTLYSREVDRLKSCVDCTNVSESENCFNLINGSRCYNIFDSVRCDNCLNIYFSRDLSGCSNCFGCVNLKNKQYHIFNKPYSKEEYFEKIKEFKLDSYQNKQAIHKLVDDFFIKLPYKFMNGSRNQNVSGDNIFFSKDIKQSFLVIGGENIRYSQLLGMETSKDCGDYTSWGQNAENVYEVVHAGDGINNIKFSAGIWQSYEIEYSDNPLFSNNLFGCVFLRKKSYCILNKQYTKEEYFEMVEKIKKQMNEMPYIDKQGREYKYGEFFPPELSPFAYNETIAQEYFPLTKEEAKKQGYKWKDPKKRNYQVTIEAKDLPDNISYFAKASKDKKDVDDSILKEVIGCATKKEDREATGCTTAFKIIPQELEFYKKMNLPLPRYCPNCRHHQRLKHRNPLKLYKRICMKEGCNTEFETTYAPDRKEIVYCEKCYQKEVA